MTHRYHHLFADVLRQDQPRRHSAEAVADLHRRASAWYKGAGLIDEAITHRTEPTISVNYPPRPQAVDRNVTKGK